MKKYLDLAGLTRFWAKIQDHTWSASQIPNLAANKITSGTFDANRIPNLSASKITSGTISSSRLPTSKTINGNSIWGSGNITIDPELYVVLGANDSLPTSGQVSNRIYLKPITNGGTNNGYEEYIYIPANGSVAAKWELLGRFSTQVAAANNGQLQLYGSSELIGSFGADQSHDQAVYFEPGTTNGSFRIAWMNTGSPTIKEISIKGLTDNDFFTGGDNSMYYFPITRTSDGKLCAKVEYTFRTSDGFYYSPHNNEVSITPGLLYAEHGSGSSKWCYLKMNQDKNAEITSWDIRFNVYDPSLPRPTSGVTGDFTTNTNKTTYSFREDVLTTAITNSEIDALFT